MDISFSCLNTLCRQLEIVDTLFLVEGGVMLSAPIAVKLLLGL